MLKLCLIAVILTLIGPSALAESGVPIPFPPEPVAGGDPNIQNPILMDRPEAVYPEHLVGTGWEDEVYVAFEVDETGGVRKVRAFFSRHEEFEAPAVAAVSSWRFTPAKLKGHPISTRMVVSIKFSRPKA